MKSNLLTLPLFVALSGCVIPPATWVKAGATQQEFERDKAVCEYEASAATANYGSSNNGYGSVSSAAGVGVATGIGQALKQDELQTMCMKAKGYKFQGYGG